jgi:hypothetical protein
MSLVKQELFTLPDRWLSIWQLSFGHCVVCPSSTYGFWLLFWYLKICLIELHIYFILMKNSKVHKVWMLIIQKGISTNRYVHSVWINRNKIERITEYFYVIQCLLVQDARLIFWLSSVGGLLIKKIVIHNSKCFWYIFLYRITGLKIGSRIYHKIFITAVLVSQHF